MYYLACGDVAVGFVRCHCEGCGHDVHVAFSCKARGLCPSCGTRRRCNEAVQIVDRVLPNVHVRQWVLSLPWELRALAAIQGPAQGAHPSRDGVDGIHGAAGCTGAPTENPARALPRRVRVPLVVAPAGDAEAAAGGEAEAVRRGAGCIHACGAVACTCVAHGWVTCDGVARAGVTCGRCTGVRAQARGFAHPRRGSRRAGGGRRSDDDHGRALGASRRWRAVRLVEAPPVGRYDETNLRVRCAPLPEMQSEDTRDRDPPRARGGS